MNDYPEIMCDDCGWEGFDSELECSEHDAASDKPVREIAFDRCPDCGGRNISDTDHDDDDEEW